MKVRTQIQLEPAEHRALKALALRRGTSVSQAVREVIRRDLGFEHRDDGKAGRRFLGLAGCGRDRQGATDVARNHDRYLYGK